MVDFARYRKDARTPICGRPPVLSVRMEGSELPNPFEAYPVGVDLPWPVSAETSLWAANDPLGMYFEVYCSREVQLTTLLWGGGEWRWRFCSSSGAIMASSSGYANKRDCLKAIEALRGGAGIAKVNQVHEN